MASYGPTATLFTIGPQDTVQQYDLETAAMVANVQHLAVGSRSTASEHPEAALRLSGIHLDGAKARHGFRAPAFGRPRSDRAGFFSKLLEWMILPPR